MEAAHYIQQSRERAVTKFSETRRLLHIWQAEFRIYLLLPNAANADAARLAYVAYRAEQQKALSTTI